MLFSEIIGQEHIKKHLTHGVDVGRIPHAQLFVGPEGSGTLPMAIAYAQYILCLNKNGENSEGESSCNLKCNNVTHPDLHFAFPVTTSSKVKSKPVSNFYIEEWRQLLKSQPYGNLFDWYKLLGVDNKQGQIGVDEAHEIVKKLFLKSYEGSYKAMIIWMAELMNTACANKLLKLIEEPPEKTIFILIAEEEDKIINTIKSRCQVLYFPPLPEPLIAKGLINSYNIKSNIAASIAHQVNGNYNKACDLVSQNSEDTTFQRWFITWVRTAFKAKKHKGAVIELMIWAETIAKTGRETQKKFLSFCLNYFRQALLLNYNVTKLVYVETLLDDFKLEKFAPFVHDGNMLEISEAIQEAIYHVERNGNVKIIFTDLSIKLTRLIHKKGQAVT